MMDNESFRAWGHKAADWSADYRANLGELPVRAQTKPGAVYNAVPVDAPEAPEAMEKIFSDFMWMT